MARTPAGLAALLALAMLALCVPASAQDGPCSCDVREIQPICGTDGITYQSACLAACQGVQVAKDRACKRADADMFAPAPAIASAAEGDSAAALVTETEINRFKEEGFTFVGVGKANPDGTPVKPQPRTARVGRTRGPKLSGAIRFVKATGHMYRTGAAGSKLAAALRDIDSTTVSPAFDPTANVSAPVDLSTNMSALAEFGANVSTFAEGGSRRLLDAPDSSGQAVFGSDDRVRVTPTTEYPWRAVGLLTFSAGGCSGALFMNPYSVLTAGHCVHSGSSAGWYTGFKFAPVADGGSRPYGSVDWEWVTTYPQWQAGGDFTYDMAVIRLKEPVGARTGWLGLSPSDTFTNLPVVTAGYPGDKPYPTMWKATCNISDNNPSDSIIRTTACDIFRGQSGSPVWDPTNFGIRGIVSFEAITSTGVPVYNGFQQLTTTRYWDALAWAGGVYTPWNDAGSNDGWKSIYADRHTPGEFCHPVMGYALSSFQLQSRYDTNPAQMRFQYGCTPARKWFTGNTVRYSTPANDWGNGNTIYWDRHNVRCPQNSLMTKFHLYRPTLTSIAFEYWCSPITINTATCENRATASNSDGGGAINFLDRHAVACPANKMLTGWQLSRDTSNTYRILYTCCGV